MSIITQGPGYLEIRYDEEVDDASGADEVEKLRIDARGYSSLLVEAWVEGQSLDIALKRLAGYNADGSEIWDDVHALAARAAASDPDAVNPATEVDELVNAQVRGGIYAMFAKLSGATAAGTLHVYGQAKLR